MSRKCRAFSKSKLGLEPADNRKAFYAGWEAALAQPEQEPVGWVCPEDPERETAFSWKAGHCENCGKQRIPLYTVPPHRKPLTEEEKK